jgi:hypothetical protein
MDEDFNYRIRFLKPTDDLDGLHRTTEDDEEATEYWVEYTAVTRASKAWTAHIKIKKNEHGAWMVPPDQFRALIDFYYRSGRQRQAAAINSAINFKAFR